MILLFLPLLELLLILLVYCLLDAGVYHIDLASDTIIVIRFLLVYVDLQSILQIGNRVIVIRYVQIKKPQFLVDFTNLSRARTILLLIELYSS